jgi:hypothetical protein
MSREFEKKSEQPAPVEITCSIQALKKFIHWGKEMGIGVTVLATAGETYLERACGPNGIMLRHIVPWGDVRV